MESPLPFDVRRSTPDDDGNLSILCPCGQMFRFPAERRGEHTGCPACGVVRHLPLGES